MRRSTVSNHIKNQKYHFCAACGREDDLQYHHLVPVSKGGKDEFENIIVLCGECHKKIHDQSYDPEQKNHNQLVKDGIARAKARGVKVGRKPADHEAIFRAIAEHSTQFNEIGSEGYNPMTENEIMDTLGIKSVCYRKYKRQLLEMMEAEVWP
jgi:uncharacterized CHY-type Zn-finger protein/DNA-directed RNA polymerase subunit N (RpoN/RPB10)